MGEGFWILSMKLWVSNFQIQIQIKICAQMSTTTLSFKDFIPKNSLALRHFSATAKLCYSFQDLAKILDESPSGAIYFSFGSNINMSEVSSHGLRDAFVRAFERIPQRVLWKWTGKDFPKVPSNVYVSDWFPQQDILGELVLSPMKAHNVCLHRCDTYYNKWYLLMGNTHFVCLLVS